MLLAKGAKVDSRAKNRFTPLHCRPPNGWSDVARVLLRAGAMVDAQAKGQTPLHWAARKGNLAVARALLEYKADTLARDRFKDAPPLSLAASKGHAAMIRLLVKHKADVEQRSKGMMRPLHWAVAGRSAPCVAALLEAGADATKGDFFNKSPIDHAEGKPELLRALRSGAAKVEL